MGPFLLTAGIIALVTAAILAFGAWKECMLHGGKNNSVVAETIYILGLAIVPRPETIGSIAVSEASSVVSIFGFGHDDDGKWTFAGRRPKEQDDPFSFGEPEDEELSLLPHSKSSSTSKAA